MNTKLRTEARNDFEIGFPKLNNLVFVKTVENIRKHIYIYIYTYIYIYIYIYIRFVATTKKNLFSVRTKLSCDKMVFRKFIGHLNE